MDNQPVLHVKKKILLFAGSVFLFSNLHFWVQFYLWAYQDAAVESLRTATRIPWQIISFPVFYLVPKDSGLFDSFWPLFFTNDLFWGIVLSVLLFRIFKIGQRIDRRRQNENLHNKGQAVVDL